MVTVNVGRSSGHRLAMARMKAGTGCGGACGNAASEGEVCDVAATRCHTCHA
jgi:hypothetical protein